MHIGTNRMTSNVKESTISKIRFPIITNLLSFVFYEKAQRHAEHNAILDTFYMFGVVLYC